MSDRIKVEELAQADVLLYHGTSFISRAIQFFDGTDFSHAALYVGSGQVGEAVATGLVQRNFAAGVPGNEWVRVYRHKNVPLDMSPVLGKAAYYLEQGNRYGYEQLLLLAFLCLTRKLRVTPSLRWLLRNVLDAAASVLTRLASQQKEPMICSEFVYRSYDEALPGIDDPFSLRISELLPAVVLGTPGQGESTLRAIAPQALPGQGIHSQSLLAFMSASSSGVWVQRPPQAREPVSPERASEAQSQLEEAIEVYLGEARGEPAQAMQRALGREAEVTVEELRAAIERFGISLYRTSHPEADREIAQVRAFGGRSPADRYLLQAAADFVTPGDLFKSQSLFLVGEVEI